MNSANPEPHVEYVKGYSIALFFLGLFSLLGALRFSFVVRGAGGDPSLTLISSLLWLIGLSCLAVALLRWVRVSAALPATTALSLCMLFVFPFGTALSIYWLTRVKPKEGIPQDVSRRAWFNYAVTLYILGLLMLDAALVLRFALSSADSGDQMLGFIEVGMSALALAAILTAALRSTKLRWAHWATFTLNMLLLLWFPLGTVLALVWFFVVRKHENKLLSEEWAHGAA